MPIPRLNIDDTVLLVIDLQVRLLPVITDHEQVVAQSARLIDGCRALGLPMIATEQYRKGLGPTTPAIADRWTADTPVIEKLKFSACVEPVRRQLAELGRRTVLLCGIEAHVCVMQTALELAESGFVVAVAGDALGSRRPADRELALWRMMQAGIVPVSVEMALLEMVHEAGTERFKSVLPIIR